MLRVNCETFDCDRVATGKSGFRHCTKRSRWPGKKSLVSRSVKWKRFFHALNTKQFFFRRKYLAGNQRDNSGLSSPPFREFLNRRFAIAEMRHCRRALPLGISRL